MLMELIYLYIEDCYRLGEQKEISFTGAYDIKLTKYSREDRKFTVSILDNPGYLKNYFENNVTNISGIIGSNGSGKTTLLEFLRRLFTSLGLNIYWP